jgi:uncharacterized protein YecT (DUF1311 family)
MKPANSILVLAKIADVKAAILIALVLCFANPVHSASFDCAKIKRSSSASVERMICADTDLSSLDEVLSELYTFEVESEVAVAAMQSSQKTWLAARNQCQDIDCVKRRYEERIAALACSSDSQMSGSAIGANQCAFFSLRGQERELSILDAQYAEKVSSASNNPEYTARVAKAEQKSWRDYRSAQCALYGALEGGSDGWKNAFAVTCELSETKARIKQMQTELSEK